MTNFEKLTHSPEWLAAELAAARYEGVETELEHIEDEIDRASDLFTNDQRDYLYLLLGMERTKNKLTQPMDARKWRELLNENAEETEIC